MKKFGRNYYQNYVYFNFDEEDEPKSYPVGMVNLLNIHPLTFDEFLEATDESL